MRFKIDENLPPELARLLREHGHDGLTVDEQGLRGHADADVGEVCQAEKRVLITLDLGFADIRAHPPEQYAVLMVLRVSSQSRRHVLAVFERLLPRLVRERLVGRLWIIGDVTVRIRGEPDAG